jgi:predicted amidohydrolase
MHISVLIAMSTPFDLGTILSSIVSALQTALQTVINVVTANMDTIITLGITVMLVGGAFTLVRKYFRNITSWFRGLFTF